MCVLTWHDCTWCGQGDVLLPHPPLGPAHIHALFCLCGTDVGLTYIHMSMASTVCGRLLSVTVYDCTRCMQGYTVTPYSLTGSHTLACYHLSMSEIPGGSSFQCKFQFQNFVGINLKCKMFLKAENSCWGLLFPLCTNMGIPSMFNW